MGLEFKIKKSGGVWVTPAVHKLISAGNRSRGGDWHAAADRYRAALRADPGLFHIWIQLGHALTEAGDFDGGAEAYQHAATLRPGSSEPYLHLGHLWKRAGRRAASMRSYGQAVIRDDPFGEAHTEVLHMMAPVPPELLRDMLHHHLAAEQGTAATPVEKAVRAIRGSGRLQGQDLATLDRARTLLETIDRTRPPADAAKRPLVFDITDLVAHFRNHRLPTGIQRVQIEVLATALHAADRGPVSICCFIDGRDYWIGIPVPLFEELAQLAGSGSDASDREWQLARARLFYLLASAEHFVMPDRAVLVNLGTSWWIYDYFLLIRNAKEQQRISYIPFVHDFIPVMTPEHVVRGVTEDYVSWVVGVFQHADFFLANSESTKTDLLRTAARLGHDVPADRVEVVALDADFRRPSSRELPPSALAAWGLEDVPYALFVSTIESRKNHLLAFEAWSALIRKHGKDKLPRLVCVGRNGWLNDKAFARLHSDPDLTGLTTIIHQVSDEQLALLYRSSRFTIYPSHYEGWGLPITESLCYGKLPVIADNSSLPEAGAGFALQFESNSVSSFVEALEKAIFDEPWLHAQETAIAEGFRPRSWAQIAGQISDAVSRYAAEGGFQPVPRNVETGNYYPVSLYKEVAIWRGLASGEIFRAGDGWLWPEPAGCRTRPEGGDLRLHVTGEHGPLRLYARLAGLAKEPCPFRISAGDHLIASGTLMPEEIRWTAGDLPADMAGDITIRVRGERSEIVLMSTGGSNKLLSASVAVIGFALCPRDDEDSRAAFLEATALGDPHGISAYRERDAA